jgi:benzoyl-CoA reductase subunit BamC
MGTRKIKTIRINASKCTGCRSCEVICSAFHYDSSLVNRERSRIRVIVDEENDSYVPIIAGPYTEAECPARYKLTIEGKEYDECFFCRSSCPSRDLFKEPDSGIPLKCDMCGEPPQDEPLCVKWCMSDALMYVEREEEGEEAEAGDKERAVEYLIKKYGVKEIRDMLDRKSGD